MSRLSESKVLLLLYQYHEYIIFFFFIFQIIFSAIFVFPMWFWINFSPIGQAPPSPKKAIEAPNNGKRDSVLEKKVDGQ